MLIYDTGDFALIKPEYKQFAESWVEFLTAKTHTAGDLHFCLPSPCDLGWLPRGWGCCSLKLVTARTFQSGLFGAGLLGFVDLWKCLVVGFWKCLPRKVRFSAPFLLNCRTRSHHYYSAIKLKHHVLHYQQLLLLESKIMLHTTE